MVFSGSVCERVPHTSAPASGAHTLRVYCSHLRASVCTGLVSCAAVAALLTPMRRVHSSSATMPLVVNVSVGTVDADSCRTGTGQQPRQHREEQWVKYARKGYAYSYELMPLSVVYARTPLEDGNATAGSG